MEITDKLLNRVDKALKIKLYPWQRDYIKGQELSVNIMSQRGNGKSLAYIIRMLLMFNGNLTMDELNRYADEPYTMEYRSLFVKEATKINEALKNAGVYRYAERQAKRWRIIKEKHFYRLTNWLTIIPTIDIHKDDFRYCNKTIILQVSWLIFHFSVTWIKGERRF